MSALASNEAVQALDERLVPRATEGASAPSSSSSDVRIAGNAFIDNRKYGRWLIDAPGGTRGPHGNAFEYINGIYDDVRKLVEAKWPPRTRIVWAPNTAPTPSKASPESQSVFLDNTASICAADIATEAARIVGGSRAATHGDKRENFAKIAAVWNGYWAAKHGCVESAVFDAKTVGDMMELMKIARRLLGSFNIDDYVDAAGYAACVGEIAAAEEAERAARPSS